MLYRSSIISIFILRLVHIAPLGTALGQGSSNVAPGLDSFYEPPVDLHMYRPGDVLRVEPMSSQLPDVRLWRMVYVSANIDDTPVAASALLAAPATPPPDQGYPLVTVGYGSVGVARECAPSMNPFRSSPGNPAAYELFMSPLVNAGHAVIMSDYQGLGITGDSSYLTGVLEGRDLLNAARTPLCSIYSLTS